MSYLDAIIQLLEQVRDTQGEAIERARACRRNHSGGPAGIRLRRVARGILAQELFYRAGGLVPVQAIQAPG